jgi:hypothetical protein
MVWDPHPQCWKHRRCSMSDKCVSCIGFSREHWNILDGERQASELLNPPAEVSGHGKQAGSAPNPPRGGGGKARRTSSGAPAPASSTAKGTGSSATCGSGRIRSGKDTGTPVSNPVGPAVLLSASSVEDGGTDTTGLGTAAQCLRALPSDGVGPLPSAGVPVDGIGLPTPSATRSDTVHASLLAAPHGAALMGVDYASPLAAPHGAARGISHASPAAVPPGAAAAGGEAFYLPAPYGAGGREGFAPAAAAPDGAAAGYGYGEPAPSGAAGRTHFTYAGGVADPFAGMHASPGFGYGAPHAGVPAQAPPELGGLPHALHPQPHPGGYPMPFGMGHPRAGYGGGPAYPYGVPHGSWPPWSPAYMPYMHGPGQAPPGFYQQPPPAQFGLAAALLSHSDPPAQAGGGAVHAYAEPVLSVAADTEEGDSSSGDDEDGDPDGSSDDSTLSDVAPRAVSGGIGDLSAEQVATVVDEIAESLNLTRTQPAPVDRGPLTLGGFGVAPPERDGWSVPAVVRDNWLTPSKKLGWTPFPFQGIAAQLRVAESDYEAIFKVPPMDANIASLMPLAGRASPGAFSPYWEERLRGIDAHARLSSKVNMFQLMAMNHAAGHIKDDVVRRAVGFSAALAGVSVTESMRLSAHLTTLRRVNAGMLLAENFPEKLLAGLNEVPLSASTLYGGALESVVERVATQCQQERSLQAGFAAVRPGRPKAKTKSKKKKKSKSRSRGLAPRAQPPPAPPVPRTKGSKRGPGKGGPKPKRAKGSRKGV